MEFRILGPLEVLDGGRPLDLGGARQRALLAILLLHRGEVLSTDRLIEELYGAHPRLRRALGANGRVHTTPVGYLLDVADDQLDAALGAAPWTAYSQVELAELLFDGVDAAEAAELLVEARATAAHLGMTALRDRIDQLGRQGSPSVVG